MSKIFLLYCIIQSIVYKHIMGGGSREAKHVWSAIVLRTGFTCSWGYQEMMETSEFLLISSVRVLRVRLLEPLGSGALGSAPC